LKVKMANEKNKIGTHPKIKSLNFGCVHGSTPKKKMTSPKTQFFCLSYVND